jgi:hypothetical protein
LRQVESDDLILFLDAHPDQAVDDLEEDPGHPGGEQRGDDDQEELDEELVRVAEEQAVGAGGVDRLSAKSPVARVPQNPAYPVDSEWSSESS